MPVDDGDDDDGSFDSSVIDSDKSHSNFEDDAVDENEEKVVIAHVENQAVWWIRVLVLLVLVASALGVALTVYFYTNNAEIEEFEGEFEDYATKIFESIGSVLDQVLGATDAFHAVIVSFARYSNSTWPFVTMPDYAVHAAKLRGLSKAFFVGMSVVVQEGEETALWGNYSFSNDAWVDEALRIQSHDDSFKGELAESTDFLRLPYIFNLEGAPVDYPGPYYPGWQVSPVVGYEANNVPYNLDNGILPNLKRGFEETARSKKIVIDSSFNYITESEDPIVVETAELYRYWSSHYVGPDVDVSEPFSDLFFPIVDSAVDGVSTVEGHPETGIGKVVAYTMITYFFRELIADVLPLGSDGINVVFNNTCGTVFTYEINGPETRFLGAGDLHDTKYDYLGQESEFSKLGVFQLRDRTYTGLELTEDYCPYLLKVYPSKATEDKFISNNPVIFTLVAVLIFAFTSFVFLLYDFLVERRQKKVMNTAVQSSAIVSSIYPAMVRDRLFAQENKNNEPNRDAGKKDKNVNTFMAKDHPKNGLKSFLSGQSSTNETTSDGKNDAPIAEHFPAATTVMFADLAGFTSWSSKREPTQVFTLLETLYYGAFDKVAKRRRVFNVETIGDCYVAVTGLPEPRKDHATAMAKFASDCRNLLNRKVQDLQDELGSDTADLKLRTGLHSGPVIAGVLRGEKARFQLFGDTVNTAARMESNGVKDKIHVSQSTADALIAAGKEHWLTARDTPIEAKGKGQMWTYWLEIKAGTASVGTSVSTSSFVSDLTGEAQQENKTSTPDEAKECDHVDWATETSFKILQQIVGHHEAIGAVSRADDMEQQDTDDHPGVPYKVSDHLVLPEFDPRVSVSVEDPTLIEIDGCVVDQLREFVASVKEMYSDHPFHNFAHACHVTRSVVESLEAVVSEDDEEKIDDRALYEKSYGISADPLVQFACVFSALVHDFCHPGIPDSQFAKENTELATLYEGKSIARQKSLDVAWELLLQDQFRELRDTICPTQADMGRFRQCVVNLVMATDVTTRSLQRVVVPAEDDDDYYSAAASVEVATKKRNKAATVVLEHLMEASVVVHTMQEWQVYQSWSKRLFQECYQAYLDGRVGNDDPSADWYGGELGLLDCYILPLAQRLKELRVFGGLADRHLECAKDNRREWAEKGQDIVQNMANRNQSTTTSSSAADN